METNRIDRNEVKKYNFYWELYENCPLIVEEFNTKLIDILSGEVDINTGIELFKEEIPFMEKEDIEKEYNYTNGYMGRLAMSEFNESFLDTPYFIKEISRITSLLLEL